MKLICPSCGATASAESWINDANCRETLLVISRLASPLPKATLGYISLFRPGQQALTWKKALRLAQEIESLTGKGYVHVQGKVDRPCPPRIWAQAMEQMVERRNSLSLPLPKGHVYLCKVAWDLADQTDAAAEQQSRTARVTRAVSPGPVASIQNPLDEYIQGLRDTKPSDEEMDEWRRAGKKL